jgi:hypothetical protein
VLNFHMYGSGSSSSQARVLRHQGKALEHLPGALGHSAKRAPAALMRSISARRMRERIAGQGELALLDAREQGVHSRATRSSRRRCRCRVSSDVEDLVPRRSAPMCCSTAVATISRERAARKLGGVRLQRDRDPRGRMRAVARVGGELFSGVNVPSKAFGEFVEHRYNTPRIPPRNSSA